MTEWDRFEAWWASLGITPADSSIPTISWKMVAWSAWKERSLLVQDEPSPGSYGGRGGFAGSCLPQNGSDS